MINVNHMKLTSIIPAIAIGLLFGATADVSRAGEPKALQSLDSIRQAAEEFLRRQAAGHEGRIKVSVNSPDRRLRLARCSRPLEAYAPPSGKTTGRVTVGVRCDGEAPWSLYVPGQVSVFGKLVVSARSVKRGQLIGKADLKLEEKDLSRVHGAWFRHPDEIVGQLADRNLNQGRIITPAMLDRPMAVKRGSQVEIIARIGGIQASMRGRALDSGMLGERIRIKNLSTERELEARIVSAGAVRVDI